MGNKIKYGKFPLNALESIVFKKKHGSFKEGDTTKVHPNTAILLRHKGIAEGDEKTTTDNKSPHWKEVVALVKDAETLEDLVQFKSDDRASVIKAVAERKIELEVI